MQRHRSYDQIIEEQFRQWELRSRSAPPPARPPTIAVSRLPGSGGRLYAEALARELGFDLFDKQIVQRIAESAHLSEALVASLDEHVRSRLTEWMMLLERERFLQPHQYLQHLTRVVGAIAQHGRAVILGRGATFLLGRGESLRVSVVSPLDLRVRRLAREQRLDELEARRRLQHAEAERREFIKRSFAADLSDPTNYDLVLNTEQLTIEDAVAATRALLVARGVWAPRGASSEPAPASP